MNLGAHIAVVDEAFPSDGSDGVRSVSGDGNHAARLLGSALPDLATVGRFRLLGSTDHAAVRDGIALHHRTDDLFHRHPWFTERNRELTGALTESGVARGPAMACSHVGIELLLDGRLTAEAEIASANDAAFAAIGHLHAHLIPLVPSGRQAEWAAFLDRLSNRSAPPRLREPPGRRPTPAPHPRPPASARAPPPPDRRRGHRVGGTTTIDRHHRPRPRDRHRLPPRFELTPAVGDWRTMCLAPVCGGQSVRFVAAASSISSWACWRAVGESG